MLLQSFVDALLCFVPIFVIVVTLFWLSSRVERRWNVEFQRTQGTNTSTTRVLKTPCWQLIKCLPEQREDCPAYQNQNAPCWEHFRFTDELLDEKCMNCQVFIGTRVPA